MKKTFKLWILLCITIGLISTSCSTVAPGPGRQIVTNTPVINTAEWALEWWLPRHETKLKEVSGGDINLIMIGDSITHGWEGNGKTVWDEYYKNRKPVNLGFSGDRTEHVIWRLQNGEIDVISPELAVLMIGTNNTGHRQDPPEDTALGIKYIIEEFRKRLPKTKILLLAIFPRSESPDDKLRIINDNINRIISAYADNRHVFYLDINNHFLDENGKLSKEIMPDLLHPNEKGYRIWAGAMEPVISKIMGDMTCEAIEKKHSLCPAIKIEKKCLTPSR